MNYFSWARRSEIKTAHLPDNLRVGHGVVDPANVIVRVRPDVYESNAIIGKAVRNEVLVRRNEDDAELVGLRVQGCFDIRADDNVSAVTVERGSEFGVAWTLGIEGKVEDDQTRASLAQPFDQFRIDGARPRERFPHFLQGPGAGHLLGTDLIQLLGRFVDPEENELIMHLGPARLAFQSVAKIGLARPNAVGERHIPEQRGQDNCAGADRAN